LSQGALSNSAISIKYGFFFLIDIFEEEKNFLPYIVPFSFLGLKNSLPHRKAYIDLTVTITNLVVTGNPKIDSPSCTVHCTVKL
jgi:hypothetical protein